MNNDICHTEEYKGYTIELWYDTCEESPRDWGNLGVIYSNHRNYNPDNHSLSEIVEDEDYCNEDGDFDWAKFGETYYYLKVYAYIHSGIALSTSRSGQFADRWDSGLFGVIVMSKEDAKNTYTGCSPEEIEERALKNLEGEIETLNQYYSGEVYGITVTDKEGDEVDCGGGYYGEDCALEEARSAVEYDIKQ